MAWLPESHSPAGGQSAGTEAWQVVPFFRGVVELPAETLLRSWVDEPRIDDPRWGPVRDREEFGRWQEATREWLLLGSADVESVRVLNATDRAVEEVLLHLEVAGERHALPVAVVSSWNVEHLLTGVRLHHVWTSGESAEQIWGGPEPAPEEHLRPVIAAHLAALHTGGLEEVMACFDDDATVRDASVDPVTARGREAILAFYANTLAATTERRYVVGSVTQDRSVSAVEVSVTVDGHRPRPGLFVYDCDPTGGILGHRIYGSGLLG